MLEFEKVVQRSPIVFQHQFNTYKNVNQETHNPIGTFNKKPNSVTIWIWGRFRALGKEPIIIKWYNKGKLFYTRRSSVNNSANGYRIYYSKKYENSGNHEVRLYNKSSLLIARKKFIVK